MYRRGHTCANHRRRQTTQPTEQLTIRPTLIVLTACVCILSAACATETPSGAQKAVGSMARAPWTFRDATFAFRVQLPVAMVPDDSALKEHERRAPPVPMAHTWAFVEAPTTNARMEPHWERVVIEAVQGVGIGKRNWNNQAGMMLKSMLDQAPGADVLDSVIAWRPDTAEIRFAVHDVSRSEFMNRRCIGTKVGRPRSTIVCIQTTARTREALAPVWQSLALVSR